MRKSQILDGFVIIVHMRKAMRCCLDRERSRSDVNNKDVRSDKKTKTPPCDRHILGEVDIVDSFYYFNPPPNHIVCII